MATSPSRRNRHRRRKVGAAVAVTTAAAVAAGSLTAAPADAAIPQLTDVFRGIHATGTDVSDRLTEVLGIQSQGIAGGVAFGPNYLIDQIAGLLGGDVVDADNVKKALELLGLKFGNETAIAIGPGFAAAIPIGEGTSASALSILGLALATDGVTDLVDDVYEFPVLDIPFVGTVTLGYLAGLIGIDRDDLPDDAVFCLGALAVANSKTAGSCLNILATVDGRYNNLTGEAQIGLTNPLSVITLLTEPERLLPVLGSAISGDPIYLLKDFARLSVNGPENLALTSDYGFERVPGGAPISIGWLGSSLGFFPGTAQTQGTGGILGGGPTFVNYLSLPSFDFAMPTDLLQIIPSLSVSEFSILDLFSIPAWSTSDVFGNVLSQTGSPAPLTLSNLGLDKGDVQSLSKTVVYSDASDTESGLSGLGEKRPDSGGAESDDTNSDLLNLETGDLAQTGVDEADAGDDNGGPGALNGATSGSSDEEATGGSTESEDSDSPVESGADAGLGDDDSSEGAAASADELETVG